MRFLNFPPASFEAIIVILKILLQLDKSSYITNFSAHGYRP